MTISSLVNTDRKGGTFPIMLKQFRRAIGFAIVRGNANLKLAHLHYVRAIAEEAAATYGASYSNNKWRMGQNIGASWFTEHSPEEYGAFKQFRNGYEFSMH